MSLACPLIINGATINVDENSFFGASGQVTINNGTITVSRNSLVYLTSIDINISSGTNLNYLIYSLQGGAASIGKVNVENNGTVSGILYAVNNGYIQHSNLTISGTGTYGFFTTSQGRSIILGTTITANSVSFSGSAIVSTKGSECHITTLNISDCTAINGAILFSSYDGGINIENIVCTGVVCPSASSHRYIIQTTYSGYIKISNCTVTGATGFDYFSYCTNGSYFHVQGSGDISGEFKQVILMDYNAEANIGFNGSIGSTLSTASYLVHLYRGAKCSFFTSSGTYTFTGSYSIAVFAAESNSSLFVTYKSMTNSATGKRYDAKINSTIFVNGGGVNYLPGSVAGTVDTTSIYS